MATNDLKTGHVIEVIGPVVDVQFAEGHLPQIHNAVRITSEGFNNPEPLDIIAEVASHLGEGRVRCVAMKPTEGLVRGMKAVDQGEAIARSTKSERAASSSARVRWGGGRSTASVIALETMVANR